MFQDIVDDLLKKRKKLAVIGLGYVGLPLAAEFSKKFDVVGFDINKKKIESYRLGIDTTNELGNAKLKRSKINFTYDISEIEGAVFYVIAVPTPIGDDNLPDLQPIMLASQTVASVIKKGSVVVYESTVYPGVTEDICKLILEKGSGLKCGSDFKIGYSPERINPGDKVHTLGKIVKIVSGIDEEAKNIISKVYSIIIKEGVYEAESIKVAEAAKIIENAQRDINIAFINELSIIFNKLGIDTQDVLRAASTKWNFMNFTPGLVGGHCIGVDPYYLIYKAQEIGYHPDLILSGRKINNDMANYAAQNIIKLLVKANVRISDARVVIMGITFKENVTDIRNSKVIDIINELKSYGVKVEVSDYLADEDEVKSEYGIDLLQLERVSNIDALVFAVPHNEYRNLDLKSLQSFYSSEKKVLVDLKGIFERKVAEDLNYLYWRF